MVHGQEAPNVPSVKDVRSILQLLATSEVFVLLEVLKSLHSGSWYQKDVLPSMLSLERIYHFIVSLEEEIGAESLY